MGELIGRRFSLDWEGQPPRRAPRESGPRCLVLTCSDLPIVPVQFSRFEPGELHILSNAGNIVPPFGADPDGQSATLEAALANPGLRDVIICGHTPCVVLRALLRPNLKSASPAVMNWLRHADTARSSLQEQRKLADERGALFALATANVLAQLEHLRAFPTVATRLAVGGLSLHAWVYEHESGILFRQGPLAGTFVAITGPNRPVP